MKKFFLVLFSLICFTFLFACGAEGENNKQPISNQVLSLDSECVSENLTYTTELSNNDEVLIETSDTKCIDISENNSLSFTEEYFSSEEISFTTEDKTVSESSAISSSDLSYETSVQDSESISEETQVEPLVYYDVTIVNTDNGTVTVDKQRAVVGEIVTLTLKGSTGYEVDSILINGNKVTNTYFNMPNDNVSVKVTFKKVLYTITKSSVTGGSITVSKTSAYYGDEVTLTNSASAGYAFSSYKVNGKSQTASTFTMPAKDTTISATFIKKIQSLSTYTFTDSSNSISSKTGNITVGKGVCTSAQNYYPFIFGNNFTNDNFYFEAEISLTNIYNNENLSKCGIAFVVKNEAYFFCIDAFKTGFGTNKWVLFVNGRGNIKNGVEWNWQDLSTRKNSFESNYTSGQYVKLAIMRIGAFYKFFCDNKLMFDMWLPNSVGTATVGIHSFNVGFEVKNAKYGVSDTVIENATAFYDQTANPTTVTVDGDIADWERNARYVYGYDNGTNYFYGAAFEGKSYVYVAMVARTNSYITSNSGTSWYLNTNFEMRFGNSDATQLYVSALPNNKVQKSGDLSGETNKIESAVIKKINDIDGYYIIYMECAIPYSVWGATAASNSTTRIGFAFRSGENASRMCEENASQWWCGTAHINNQYLTVEQKGITVANAPRVYTSNVSQIATIPIPTTDIRNVQGGWTDGTYYYQLFIKIRSNVDNETILVKFNLSTGKEVARSGILPVDHANDLAYDTKNNRFVIVHNGSTANTISFLNASTLKITGSKVLNRNLCGLDYNATKNQYVALISGTFNFIIYDENFNEVGGVVTTKSNWIKGFTRQGIACNDNYIAYILYKRDVIVVYDWSGTFVSIIEVDFPHNEGENITFISKTNYTSGFYVSSNDLVDYLIGADVFKITLKYRASN